MLPDLTVLGKILVFHGSGFLSSAHGEREAELTVSAFEAALPRLQAEGLA